MDDFDDKMDSFFTYSIISGEFDDDKKASKRKEDSKRDDSQRSSFNYGKTTRRTPKKKTEHDSSIEKTNDDIHPKGKENDDWKIYVVVCAWLFAILTILYVEFFYK